MTKPTYKKKKLFKRNAFTLVELLIVIAIIGILFIVLVSKMDFATDKAKATGVNTDFRSFELAFETVSRENAGFNTFGWDTGDLNADGKRNHYDEGDLNQNGKRDPDEIWTGHTVYTETWTGVYTLTKPGTTNYDRDALDRLENAINANLDSSLQITISDSGVISMANGAQDPWNTEYHGYYITNATVDKKDRGAIVMYSNGANQTFGSTHSISNGVVTINIPDSNLYGKDDYNLSVVYTYTNGYGEIITDKNTVSSNSAEKPNVTPEIEGGGTNNEPETPPSEPATPTEFVPGLYKSGSNYTELIYTWQQLIDLGVLKTNGAVVGTGSGETTPLPETIELLAGELAWPKDLTSVPAYALKDCVNITGIKLHDNVSSLGNYCFSATGIEHFTVPPKVTKMYYTFINAKNLVSVDIHDDVQLFDYTFDGCSSLETARIPEGVTVLNALFEGCSNLHTIYLPSTITHFESAGFWNCPKLDNVYFAGTIEQWCKIDMDAFGYFGNPMRGSNTTLYINNEPLEHLVIPETITTLTGSFNNVDSLKSVVFHDKMTEIGSYAFAYCNNLESITFTSSIKTIGDHAFKSCTNIKNLSLCEGLEVIDSYAFEDTYLRQTIFIPNSVKEIRDSAFRLSYCTIKWDAVNSQLEKLTGGTFYGCYFYDLVIPDNLTTLTGPVFNEAYYTTLHIGKNLQSITRTSLNWAAFHDSSRYLTSITVDPDNEYFYVANGCLMNATTEAVILGTRNCTAIPYYATAIEPYAFYNCYGLTSITIPDTITRIEAYTFYNCYGLTSITIPDTITRIEAYTFFNCYNLTSVELPATIEYFGYAAFNKCSKLTSITINSTSIPTVDEPQYLFGGCTALTDIYVNADLVEQYKASEYWSIYANRIKSK